MATPSYLELCIKLKILGIPGPYCRSNLVCKFSLLASLDGSVESASNWRPGGHGFDPRQGWQHSFMEIDHEIFSMAILSIPLIQEGQLSVSAKRMCTILVNCLED